MAEDSAPVPRVMLITTHPPGSAGVGGIFLGDLCLLYPEHSICCFAVTEGKSTKINPALAWLPIRYANLPRQHGFRRLGAGVERLTAPLARQFARTNSIPALAEQAVAFGRQHNVNLVWAVLEHPALFELVERVVSKLSARLVTTVYDPPETLMQNLKYDSRSFRAGMATFERLLRAASGRGVASAGMQEEYQRRYNINSEVMIHSPASSLWKAPAYRLKHEGRVVIGFAGTLYARREWEALLAALSGVGWRLDGREVTIRFLGTGLDVQATGKMQGKMRIEYFGWRTVEETIDALAECDIAYLPYWFDAQYRLSTRLCFPGKLPIYLAAGLALFFHGPEDASPAKFLRVFPAGVACHSLEADEIVDSLLCLASEGERFAAAVQAGQDALQRELNVDTFRRRFAALLGVQMADLRIP